MSTTQLAPGLRSVLSEFESATKGLVQADFDFRSNAIDEDDLQRVEDHHDRRKQALLRKLLRAQNGTEVIDVEALKRDARRLARVVRAIQMAPANAREIVEATEVSALVTHIIEGRKHRQHHVLLDGPRPNASSS